MQELVAHACFDKSGNPVTSSDVSQWLRLLPVNLLGTYLRAEAADEDNDDWDDETTTDGI